jgi:hypothetical protein
VHGITRATSSLGDPVQQEPRGIIGDKEVQPPSPGRVRFHTVEELAVTVFNQFAAKALTIIIDCPTVGSPGLGRLPTIEPLFQNYNFR